VKPNPKEFRAYGDSLSLSHNPAALTLYLATRAFFGNRDRDLDLDLSDVEPKFALALLRCSKTGRP